MEPIYQMMYVKIWSESIEDPELLLSFEKLPASKHLISNNLFNRVGLVVQLIVLGKFCEVIFSEPEEKNMLVSNEKPKTGDVWKEHNIWLIWTNQMVKDV